MMPLTTPKNLNLTLAILAILSVMFSGVEPGWAQEEAGEAAVPAVYVCPPCGAHCHLESFENPGECPNSDCGMTLVVERAPRNVAIVIWDGAEILDFTGPTEVFASARGPNGRLFNVYTVAATSDPIVSQGVVTIVPEYTIENCPKPDLFVLPGGGTNRPLTNPAMIEWVRTTSDDAEVAMSVCTGAYVLAAAGQLEGLQATTYHGAIEGLRMIAPNTMVYDNQRWVDNGHVVTTAGVSAGIDGSLHVVERLCGPDIAWATAEYMEYNWRPEEVPGLIASPGAERRYTLGQRITQRLLAEGVDAAWAMYSAALGTPDESALPSENGINQVGYRYLSNHDLETALAAFTFNVKAHPEAFNAWDSLGEAYMIAGENDKAIECYRKSIELNPDNVGGVKMLEKLGATP